MADLATLWNKPTGHGQTSKSDSIAPFRASGASIGEKFAPKVKEDDFFDDDEDDKVEDDLEEDEFEDDLDDETLDEEEDEFDDEDLDDDEDDDEL